MSPADRRSLILRKAVALLALRERSVKGLSAKLRESFDEAGDTELIESVLEELKSRNYQSDERFARTRIMVRGSRYGDRRIRDELRREGLDQESIDAAFEESGSSEVERAYLLWERKFGEVAADPREKARQFRYLASRGFSFRTIEKVMRGNPEEDF